MFLQELDFLSPSISLFYRGHPSHSSPISGILSIMTVGIIIFFSIFHLKNLFKRDSETPVSATYTYFIEDAGKVPLKAKSLFHFISFQDYKDKSVKNFNYSYFNVIGFEDTISAYERNNNISTYDHWLYGFCNNSSDIEGIEDITTQPFLTYSSCIRKYFNSKNQRYYETNDSNFRYPSISHGTFHPENKIYSIIIKACEQKILSNVFNGELTCKNIKEFDTTSMSIHLNFVDQYFDVLKYKNPIGNYFFRIENKVDVENYSINHINFNPSMLKSNNGYLLDKTENYFSFYYDRNDVFTYKRTDNDNLYMGYSFYLNNRQKFYERTYQNIQTVLSTVGGSLNIVIFIMTLINDFICSYIILRDFNFLMNLFAISTNDIESTNKRNILNKKLKEVEQFKKNSCAFSRAISNENIIITEEKETKDEKEEVGEKDEKEDKDTITNQTLNTEKWENVDVDAPKEVEVEIKPEIDRKKSIGENTFKFWDYFIYKVTFGKKHDNIKYMKISEKNNKCRKFDANLFKNE